MARHARAVTELRTEFHYRSLYPRGAAGGAVVTTRCHSALSVMCVN